MLPLAALMLMVWSQIPPHFNTLVGQRATSLVPFAILIHLIMSIWVLSNNSLFSTNVDENSSVVSSSVFGDTIANKITAKATFPLFVTFCVLIFLRVAMTILRMFWSSLAKVRDDVWVSVSTRFSFGSFVSRLGLFCFNSVITEPCFRFLTRIRYSN